MGNILRAEAATMMMNRRGFLRAAALLPAALPAAGRAASDTAGLRDLGPATVIDISGGDLLRLADGRDARPAGIETAGTPSFAAAAARHALAAFTDGQSLRLWAESAEPDRRGRLTVHLQRTGDGAWAQEALLAGGHARVRPVPGDDARARALLPIEDAARRAGRGIWATRVHAVRPATDTAALLRDAARLTLVEGRPTAAQTRSGKIYLDFGDDWRRDFTAVILRQAARGLTREGVDAGALIGRALRVRGWPERRFGPQIEIIVPAQLEVLD